jgi:8-oxo-dGTP pyrophosphatase MutT (NUDIX family)
MSDPSLERPEWLDDLTDALSEQSRLDQVVGIRPGIGARPAAVLILIGDGPDGPEIMFVERAAGMRTHPGQIAFPGGAADVSDHDLADTALREAAEETGVDRGGIEVLGVLPPAYVEVSGFDVTERRHRSISCRLPYSLIPRTALGSSIRPATPGQHLR